MAIIAIVGGIYLWFGRAGLPAATLPWITGISIASILSGALLWLRVPAAKWLGVLVCVGICGLGVRRLMLDGFSIRAAIGVLVPVIVAVWMARIDYSQKFEDEDVA